MPTQTRTSAPSDRVYKSTSAPQQIRFPDKRKRIKSYGKRTSARVLDQNTITQMDFLKQYQSMEEFDDFPANESKAGPKKRRKTADDADFGLRENSKRKRRKTTGDERVDASEGSEKQFRGLRRKPTNDEPPTSSNFHTQTLTQLGSFTSTSDQDDAIYNVQSSPPRISGIQGRRSLASRELVDPIGQRPPSPDIICALTGSRAPPRTPARKFPSEIPSSQSPATPISVDSGSPRKRLPLQEQAINIPFSLSLTAKKTSIRRPELKVEDTFDTTTQISQIAIVASSPSRRISPPKSVRFAIPDPSPSSQSTSLVLKEEPYQAPLLPAEIRSEIDDSDAETDDDAPGSDIDIQSESEEQPETETCYGDLGPETQVEAERILTSTPTQEIKAATQDDANTDTFNEKSRFLESQRLSTQAFNMMAPRTANSDIFISIHPRHVTNIVNRTKDHEFLGYAIPPTVSRIWIYETSPVQTLKYMAVIGRAKEPGEIADEKGISNAEFNNRQLIGARFAHEILQLYELADPVSYARMKSNEWIKGPVQKYVWVRPAVIDHLMANLKPALFVQSNLQDLPASSTTDTQEVEAQMISTMIQFTQSAMQAEPFLPTMPSSATPQKETQTPMLPQDPAKLKRLSQATTVDLTQLESQTPTSSHNSFADVVWESPSRPVPSSTPAKLPSPNGSTQQSHPQPDSIIPFSLASSQLLTKSQMLPASLMDHSVPRPPEVIEDSDLEDDY